MDDDAPATRLQLRAETRASASIERCHRSGVGRAAGSVRRGSGVALLAFRRPRATASWPASARSDATEACAHVLARESHLVGQDPRRRIRARDRRRRPAARLVAVLDRREIGDARAAPRASRRSRRGTARRTAAPPAAGRPGSCRPSARSISCGSSSSLVRRSSAADARDARVGAHRDPRPAAGARASCGTCGCGTAGSGGRPAPAGRTTGPRESSLTRTATTAKTGGSSTSPPTATARRTRA